MQNDARVRLDDSQMYQLPFPSQPEPESIAELVMCIEIMKHVNEGWLLHPAMSSIDDASQVVVLVVK